MGVLKTGSLPGNQVLGWYDRHRRDLPWRAAPGERADPYQVWLSEIMLQQTLVKAVIPYFEKFLAYWPTVTELAHAKRDAVLSAWAGLGYYARARNLHACAQVVAREYGGRFPDSEAALLALPGIGAYTAAAIAAIAHDAPVVPLDGNIERVTARYFGIHTPLPGAKKALREAAQAFYPGERAGDLAQALMDIGAGICTPRNPGCMVCPLAQDCRGFKDGNPENLPVKAAKKVRPVRYGVAFWVERGDGAILLRRRADKGLLGGMMEIPSSPWLETRPADVVADHAPLAAVWEPLAGTVTHVFTHFSLELAVMRARFDGEGDARETGLDKAYRWVCPAALDDEALPSVMRKVVRHAQNGALYSFSQFD